MSVLKYFKNIPRSPPIGRQALSVIFFFKFAMRSLEKKGPVARWGATGACRPAHGRPAAGPSPPLPSSFEPENSTKNLEKKRGVRRREAAKPCRIQHL